LARGFVVCASVFSEATVGGFVLPSANPRHAHEFRCFARHTLADDQVLVAGARDFGTTVQRGGAGRRANDDPPKPSRRQP
jgi:hypothetical protein